jgi:hypothetical protein
LRSENLKQLFFIEQAEYRHSELLAMQIGEKHFAYAITDKTGQKLKQLAWCLADDRNLGWNEKELSDMLYHFPELKNNISTVNISYQFNDADWKNEFYFYMPEHIKKFTDYFHTATFRKQYSMVTDLAMGLENKDRLFVDFRNEEFSVIGLAGKQLLLAQTYRYETPEDVLYYLLKICKHFLFSQENVAIELSGLIEKQSSLYKELYQYFTDLRFREGVWRAEGHPAHFFTTLNDLASCAS